jgi:hypothetical protein
LVSHPKLKNILRVFEHRMRRRIFGPNMEWSNRRLEKIA